MILFDRRAIIAALGAVALIGCDTAPPLIKAGHSLNEGFDIETVKEISLSYAKATQTPVTNSAVRHLFVKKEISLEALKLSVAKDFKQGRIFTHKGWYLSYTEGKLFTLLSNRQE